MGAQIALKTMQIFLAYLTSACHKALLYGVFLTCSIFSTLSQANELASEQTAHTRVSVVSSYDSLIPGGVQYFALRLEPEAGWHTYWRNPGEVGKATTLDWQLPQGVKAGELEWPMPERKEEAAGISFIYPGEVLIPFALAVGENLDFDQVKQRFIAAARWLVCKDVCIPEQATLEFEMPVAVPGALRESLKTASAGAIEKALVSVPKLRRDIFAEFNTYGEGIRSALLVQVSTEYLPAFVTQPKVFVTEQGVVDERQLATIDLGEEYLTITFRADEYLEEPPPFFGLILSGFSADDDTHIELHVEHYPDLAIGANSLLNLASPAAISSSTNSSYSLLPILLFAFLGGLILNAMPCVFPVLSLKIMGLVESGANDSSHRQQHGLAYTAGVVISFVAVASTLIVLRALGQQIGWGFQLQSSWFVAVVALIIFVLGLSMSGFLEIGGRLQNIGSEAVSKTAHPIRGAFWTGVLATIVATPCTAPFMGTAMGFALSQPMWLALLVFVVMGLGLASPFLLIAFIPVLGTHLPRPGIWMVRFKELLAFPLYLTAVWLLWVFARQQSIDAAAILLVAAILLAMAIWAWGNARETSSMTWRGFAAMFALLAIYGVYSASSENSLAKTGSEQMAHQQEDEDGFAKLYSPAVLQGARDSGDIVLVNMTADWCITCKVNERVALKNADVEQVLAADGVQYIKGDWTNSDPQITQYLAQFGRNGVPLYVVYHPSREPVVLPQILTPETVLEALR